MVVTIIVPVYNVEEYVIDCLDSIGQQSINGCIECLIIDDAGNDQSIHLAKEYISNYSGAVSFRIIHHNCNLGLGAARNTGLLHASGDYILFVDSDDLLLPDALANLVGALSEDTDLVIAPYCKSDDPDNEIGSINQEADIVISPFHDYVHNTTETIDDRSFYVTAWGKLIKRTFVMNHGFLFPEGVIYEDMLWSFMLFSSAKTVKKIGSPAYYYRIRPNSIITGSNTEKWLDGHVIMINQIVDYCRKESFWNSLIWTYLNYYYRRILDVLDNNINIPGGKIVFHKLVTGNRDVHFILYNHGVIGIKDLIKRLYFSFPKGIAYHSWRITRFVHNFEAHK